jgi:hypothetical protein
MNTRTARRTRFSAAACAAMISAISAWTFLNSTASGERDPFQFASIRAANAELHVAEVHVAEVHVAEVHVTQTVGSQGGRPPEEVAVYTPPDLLAVPPLCLGSCA